MTKEEQKIMENVHLIQDNILTMTCPNPSGCKAPYFGFDEENKGQGGGRPSDCMCLKCAKCKGHFCAWCVTYLGTNSGTAHDHVRKCPLSMNRGDYWAAHYEQFDASNRRYKTKKMLEFLSALTHPQAQTLVSYLLKDLVDNQLGQVLAAYPTFQ